MKFSKELQAEAAVEIEDAGCDPDKTPASECKINALLTLLKDALNVLDQLAVARNEQKAGK